MILPRFAALVAVASVAAGGAGNAIGSQDPAADPRQAVVRGYAAWCHHLYGDCAARARALQQAVAALLADPQKETLAAARAAWCDGRRVYAETEVFRFYDGPIESLEPSLNAWPVDEAYIDAVVGNAEAGIINDPKNFPNLGAAVLLLANERGGEANISVGWHAIEFLLWGQDLRADGPGDRPVTDFVPGRGHNAARRREYLTVTTALLVRQLEQLEAAWAPDTANYRRTFEADAGGALRRMLTGAAVLSAFELCGERLAVAYETRDQEQEHSCFSDMTWQDLEHDQLGILAIFKGGPQFGPGLMSLLTARDPAVAADLEQKLAQTLARLRAIPKPFDQAMLGDDAAPGRTAIRAAIEALEAQTDALAIAGRRFGFDLPLKPGG